LTLPGHLRNRISLGEFALWASAGLVAFAAHAGAVAVILQDPPPLAADTAPPAAIMIELAAEAQAIETDENQIVPDQVDAEEIKTATVEPPKEPIVEPPPEPTPEPLPEPEPEPVEKVEELPPEPIEQPEPAPEEIVEEVDPIEEMALAQLENVEVPLPMTRPPVPEKPKEKPKKVTQKTAPVASQAAHKAKAEVKQSDRIAATQTNSTTGSASVSPAKWQSRLMSHLERRKRYPSESRKNKEEGTAYVRFTIDTSGNVTSISLSRSSGYPSLDKAVVDMVRRASPVPAPPPGVNRTIVAPVRFNLR
jgi:TonB family C-terminal domain